MCRVGSLSGGGSAAWLVSEKTISRETCAIKTFALPVQMIRKSRCKLTQRPKAESMTLPMVLSLGR
jgi:hypothetical protein